MPDQKCMRCRTYFRGVMCPRCDYTERRKQAPWLVRYYPEHRGRRQKDGDSEVRIVQEAYRATDPCE